ncbi:MAG: GNAT family N-acetyltransferase [Clostridia bacterium]|nr:GNAT family N-acetyltransferase [Clostridia bacterium]
MSIKTDNIRSAEKTDAFRLAEIELFNYRLNFYPIFKSDEYFFKELSVPALMAEYEADEAMLERAFVYDDGVVKGFIRVKGEHIEKLFVEPVFQRGGIGEALLAFAVKELCANELLVLEKNKKAIRFYKRNGFYPTVEKQFVDDTSEYLIKMKHRG